MDELIKGGQGRSSQSIKTDAVVTSIFMLIAFAFGAASVMCVVIFQPHPPAPQINVEPSAAQVRSKFYFRPMIKIDTTLPIRERVEVKTITPNITVNPSDVIVQGTLPERLRVEVTNWPKAKGAISPPETKNGVLLPPPIDVR